MQGECKQVQMSANLKSFTVRVNTEACREASDKSALLGISMTELVRAAVHQFCTQSENSGSLNQELNPLLIDNLEILELFSFLKRSFTAYRSKV